MFWKHSECKLVYCTRNIGVLPWLNAFAPVGHLYHWTNKYKSESTNNHFPFPYKYKWRYLSVFIIRVVIHIWARTKHNIYLNTLDEVEFRWFAVQNDSTESKILICLCGLCLINFVLCLKCRLWTLTSLKCSLYTLAFPLTLLVITFTLLQKFLLSPKINERRNEISQKLKWMFAYVSIRYNLDSNGYQNNWKFDDDSDNDHFPSLCETFSGRLHFSIHLHSYNLFPTNYIIQPYELHYYCCYCCFSLCHLFCLSLETKRNHCSPARKTLCSY